MVTSFATRRRGASTVGCLLSLMLTLGMLYYGTALGRIWWRYRSLLDRMETEARFAGSQSDDQVVRQLQSDALDIGIPAEGHRFRIERIEVPRGITISTSYQERVDLPLLHKTFSFHPSVSQRL